MISGGLVAGQGPALVDQLAEHAVAFVLVFRIGHDVRRQRNRACRTVR